MLQWAKQHVLLEDEYQDLRAACKGIKWVMEPLTCSVPGNKINPVCFGRSHRVKCRLYSSASVI